MKGQQPRVLLIPGISTLLPQNYTPHSMILISYFTTAALTSLFLFRKVVTKRSTDIQREQAVNGSSQQQKR